MQTTAQALIQTTATAATVSPMTVANLADIVQSQLCLYGDKALFARVAIKSEDFMLFVGTEPILECVNYIDSNKEDHGLKRLCSLLDLLDDDEQIICSSEYIQQHGFTIGFRTDEGFIQTLNSNELVQLTEVE
jgi:hypothetical protein